MPGSTIEIRSPPRFIATGTPSSSSNPEAPPSPLRSSKICLNCSSRSWRVRRLGVSLPAFASFSGKVASELFAWDFSAGDCAASSSCMLVVGALPKSEERADEVAFREGAFDNCRKPKTLA